MSKTMEEIQEIVNKAPETCPITGLTKCESYTIEDKVVYLNKPAYDAFTLPEYNFAEEAFYRTHYDMDDNYRKEVQYLCGLNDLEDRVDFEQIKKFYGIEE